MLFQPAIFSVNNPNDYSDIQKVSNLLSAKILSFPTNLLSDEYFLFIQTEKSIGVKDVEEILEWNFKKVTNFIKVIVILNAQKLTTEAQNSLLKTLEEPNANTLILLFTTNVNLLLETVLSRCRVFNEHTGVVSEPEFVREFIEEKNLQTRAKLIEKISKGDNAREMSLSLLEYVLKFLLTTDKLNTNMHILNVIEWGKECYIALSANTNIKLTLDTFNFKYQDIFN